MENILEFMKSDIFLIGITGFCLLIFILYLINIARLGKLRKEYKEFMKKIGNGTNLEEILSKHVEKINKAVSKNEELEKFCNNLDTDIKHCIQKIGIYRYNAYKDTGSDLSFTLALMDENNDGVVLNGIYSREMSNIYAKPLVKGKSEYKITEEESEAIKRALNSSN
ncbi:MAG: DUF4446 family protein [Clostridia bacterium]|nr:DUF4446 family protein [Clostridia bacterium]